MDDLLLLMAVKKAEEELDTDVITKLTTHLSDFIVEDAKQPYGERTLREKYNAIKENENRKIELKGFAKEALSHYLGYKSFAEFVRKNKPKEKGFLGWVKRNKIALTIGLSVLVLTVSVLTGINKQRWMVWQEDRYVEVEFDLDKYDVGELKIYRLERIKHFRRITPDCSTEFLKADGSENLWYGKNAKGELEYFTDLGLHPETGETLKKITEYMIRKHICDTYE